MGVPERQNGGDLTRDESLRHVVVFGVIGVIAGWLASWIVGGGGLLTYLVSGVIGAFVGGNLFSALKINLRIKNIWISQVLTATVGAIIVVLVARLIAGS